MIYLIAHLIKGKAAKVHQKIVREVAEKFEITGAVKTKIPSHLTLKAPFSCKEINEVEEVLKEFCSKQRKSNYQLSKFGHFKDRVIFIDVKASSEMKQTYSRFVEKLLEVKEIKFGEKELKAHFHLTIAKGDVTEKFNSVWDYLQNYEKEVNFDQDFDNIAILKLIDGEWVTHKEFELR